MPPTAPMQLLTTVQGSFHGRVVAARLGAEGVFAELRGLFEGPYPLPGPVDVWVPSEQLDLAREILLADAVEDALYEAEDGSSSLVGSTSFSLSTRSAGPRSGFGRPGRLFVLVALGIVVMLLVAGISVVVTVY